MWNIIKGFLRLAVTSDKGEEGEIVKGIQAGFRQGSLYKVYENVTLPTPDGTTQIDLLILSRYGIFVVEVKNYSGWIFGNEKQPKWTQVHFNKKKYPFQNPLRQNFKHTEAVRKCLEIDGSSVFSVVNFTVDAEFKTPMPPNVTRGPAFTDYIKSHSQTLFTDEQVLGLRQKLEAVRLPPGRSTDREHRANMQKIAQDPSSAPCPKCGGRMVERIARKGKNAGKSFLGCSNYRSKGCSYTRNASI